MFTVFVYCNFLVLQPYACSQNINKQIVNIADQNLTDYSFLGVGITIPNQRIIKKDDIEFVTEFPCLLGHPVDAKCHRSDFWKIGQFIDIRTFYRWTFYRWTFQR